MFNWLFHPSTPPYPLLDMHSHVLPGIDDGAAHVEESVALIRAMWQLGYRQWVATPHVMADLHPNTPGRIGEAANELNRALANTPDLADVQVRAAAEYMLDEQFEHLLDSGEALLCLDDQQHLLVELPQAGELPRWEYTLFTLQTRGYRPVLAHPERYRYLSGDFERLERLRDSGVALQANLISFAGYYGAGPEKMAKELLRRKLLDFAGTDVHHQRHIAPLKALVGSKAGRNIGAYAWRNAELQSLAAPKNAGAAL